MPRSAADVACFNDLDDSPVSGEFAYDAYYHTLANTVTPAEAGRFFRKLADHQLHDVFDEASLVRELDKNGGYSNFTGTYFDAWGGKDGGKYKVKTWIGLTWNWDNATGDYTSLTHQFAIAVFTENWTTDDTTGDNLAASIIQTVVVQDHPVSGGEAVVVSARCRGTAGHGIRTTVVSRVSVTEVS